MPSLLEEVSNYENLYRAFMRCARGKRKTAGYAKALHNLGENLTRISRKLHADEYEWSGYREFYVTDPKRRLVMSAPFLDRVVHHAIHAIVEPYIEPTLHQGLYSCRKGRGNRHAALAVLSTLRKIGESRYVVKLDVEGYYESIHHETLFRKVTELLPDRSLDKLLWTLITNQTQYRQRGCGIPIGNLTSQLFANLYLASADRLAESLLPDGYVYRYMDDIVLIARSKAPVMHCAWKIVEHVKQELHLRIPHTKLMPIANAPVPFLGYVLDHTGFRILARNGRRIHKKVKRLQKRKVAPSELLKVWQSFDAWQRLEGNPPLIDLGRSQEPL